jgi:hypothetical protein
MSITLSASTCLTSGETITVVARHFTPGEAILVLECADKGTTTLNPDCTSPTEVVADASGTVRATLSVIKGPFPTESKHIHAAPFPITFGANHPTCSTAQPCLVSASEEKASGGAEADAHITFA